MSPIRRRHGTYFACVPVVTIAGLIGTLSTGFLGMNLLAEADASWARRLSLFGLTVVASLLLTGLCVVYSKRLSDLLDLLSDERLALSDKWSSWRQHDDR